MLGRRCFLAVVANSLAYPQSGPQSTTFAPFRYDDLATDFAVLRLTDPATPSLLPSPARNPLSRRNASLVYAANTGSWQVFSLDLKKNQLRQITTAAALLPTSLLQLPDQSALLYFDGDQLMLSATRTVEVQRASSPTGAIHASTDFQVAYVDRAGPHYRLRLLNLRTRVATTLAESDDEIHAPLFRPKRASILYRRANGLFLVSLATKRSERLRIPSGDILDAHWSPDGRSVLYLHAVSGQQPVVRENVPDAPRDPDQMVAETSNYAALGRNADASMFVGAGSGKVAPYLFVLARAVRRELTLCEHRASDPSRTAVQFSPNSQQVYFNSDLHGQWAIYRLDVAKLVAETA
jgi:oligogalacturonide lyase